VADGIDHVAVPAPRPPWILTTAVSPSTANAQMAPSLCGPRPV